MNKEEKSIQEIRELMSPIKERPDLEPRPEFVRELRTRIQKQKTSNHSFFIKKSWVALTSVALLVFVIVLSSVTSPEPDNVGNPTEEMEIGPIPILEQSQVELVTTVEYGKGENQVGRNQSGFESGNVSSFDIEDGTFYILDDKNKKILIKNPDGTSRSIPVGTEGFLMDILVNKDIYVLDSDLERVYQYSADGSFQEFYDLSESISLPMGIEFVPNYGVAVNQDGGITVSIETGEQIPVAARPYNERRVSDTEGRISFFERDYTQEFTIDYESFASLSILAVTDEQVVYEKGDFIPELTSHVFVTDLHGSIQGGVRIPVENTVTIPRHFVKVDGKQIYFLSPEEENLAIYELKPGEQYEAFLGDMGEVEEEKEDYVFDPSQYGEPFPELKEEIESLFTGDTIFAYWTNGENFLNGVAIDDEGTVVVDFKHFNVGGPASAEAMSMSNVLYKAVFQFPEVQQVYYQFDGSFSDWVRWLESVEEPVKRDQERDADVVLNGMPYSLEEVSDEENEEIKYPEIQGNLFAYELMNKYTKAMVEQHVKYLKSQFPEFPNGTIDWEYSVSFNKAPYLSVGFHATFSDPELAHPVTFSKYVSSNIDNGYSYSILDFVTEPDDVQKYVIEEIKNLNMYLDTESIEINYEQDFYLGPESLIVHFDRYEINNSMAPIEIEIPNEFLDPRKLQYLGYLK
ncbi:hypothetical protein GCM10008967_05670 [Bacillus carboniphilus]|uniref:DUF3298 domain-containing protein n=1 Tax=Bacillus carboniphilus TaxID=86663 RepID=A0ABP3FLA8_9BACI